MATSFRKKKKDSDFDTIVKLWEKTIDVQMHFNELQMKVRNFSILLISSLVGVGGVAMKEHLSVDVPLLSSHSSLPLATVLFAIAALVWLSFFFMDHYWYFPLLKGAVAHGLAIEKASSEKLPAIKLTTAIGDASPIVIPIWRRKNRNTGVKENVWALKVRSQHKSFVFYGSVFTLLIVLTVTSCSPSSNLAKGAKQTGLSLTPPLSVSNTPSVATTNNHDSRGEDGSERVFRAATRSEPCGD